MVEIERDSYAKRPVCPLDTSSDATALLVILAPPRCYTTLLCAMLGQHPQMFGLAETYLFTRQTMRQWWTAYQGCDRSDGLARVIAELVFKAQTEATIIAARRWLRDRLDHTTADILRALSSKVAPLIPVEKTPQTSIRLAHMQRVINNFPRARFIHLLRHPFGQVRSRLNRRLKNLRNVKPSTSLAEAAKQLGGSDPQALWHSCNLNILAFLTSVPPSNHMRIRSEGLLADPDRHLREIAEWLDVRSDPEAIEAMKHPERSPFACFGPANASKGGDENFLEHPSLRCPLNTLETLETSLPWTTDGARFGPQVRDLAKFLGYR